MEIEMLRRMYRRLPMVDLLADEIRQGRKKVITLFGLQASSLPVALSSISCDVGAKTFFIILNDEEEAGYFYHDLCQLQGDVNVLFFASPFRRHSRASAQRDAGGEILRTQVLARLARDDDDDERDAATFIISYPDAVSERVRKEGSLLKNILTVRHGERMKMTAIATRLDEMGFMEVDYVYEPGQYAMRGGIVDVFSFSSEYPFRVDFFGDDVDSIRTFDVQTQLSLQELEAIEIVGNIDASAEGDEEALETSSIIDIMPDDTLLVTRDFRFICDSVEDEDFQRRAKSMRRIDIRAKSQGGDGAYRFNTVAQPLFHKNFDLLKETLEDYINRSYRIFILADSSKQHQRLKDIFEEQSRFITFTPVERTLHEGFVDGDLKACFFTDHQIFDRFHKYNLRSEKVRSGKVALTLKELQQFEVGDFIVHVDHGIGRFEGLVRLPQGDGFQEMIKIGYQNNDTIYVSIHSLHKVSKYKGKEGAENVKLSRLGTGAWENLKARTKKKIKDIARDLIRLYATRRRAKGFAFSSDCFMQHELEASFLYEDTPDQLKATNDVKADMERPQPMDRLICGDVGFGKTEVAVRAAFKAACDGKQVAVLVPTTVLAFQHYKTFSERLRDLPVRVDYLSRARSAKKTTALLQDLQQGKIDIIIGTHKLISKTVHFHDLGLLIIDEEQKFGVAVKEKLRQIKTNVDTITMSATPIPRTLQFSLMGARDMSVIQTPPPNRYPIQTEVHTFDADLIADAIRFEMDRNGQVFFVSNRINSLDDLYNTVKRRLPECRIAIGHGQMKPEELENIIMGFVNYDYDVLLSTTIVENGIDIPNANTIIINNAQHFGLSDLHQMRGRVGRGNRKAFCYLLAPPLSALPLDARRRLEAIENFSDLGSGIHLAMQDLDIRGAGNLLGSEQSGFIADLGYETYQKILSEAVAEIRNEESDVMAVAEGEAATDNSMTFVSDCSLETDLEMYFPESYVPSSGERMMLYRELDSLKSADEVERFRARLIDRFGEVPSVGEDLMRVVLLRQRGVRLGIERIMLKQGRMNLGLVTNNDSPYYQSQAFDALLQFIATNPRRCQIKEVKGKRIISISSVASVSQAIEVLRQLIIDN
ncbi:MAG: transcription-repair coupling factor [Prevotella sp.]|nr:transcription-repair coupling factor [Candidatus Equicola faecalis]